MIDDISNPNFFFNREISHLKFHQRVLEQSMMEHHPLLERLKFLLIFSNNLDEFFEIRVAGLKRKIETERPSLGSDGLSPKETLDIVRKMCHEAVDYQYNILNQVLFPALAHEGIEFIKRDRWERSHSLWAKRYFRQQVLPVLSPIALTPSHPFPKLANKTLNFVIEIEGKDAFGRNSHLAIVPAPRSLPRIIKIPNCEGEDKHQYVFLSSIIHACIEDIFPGMTIKGCYQFRVTRNADLHLAEDEIDDLAHSLKGELFSRKFGDAVRLEVADNCPTDISDFLLEQFELAPEDLFRVNGMVNLSRLFEVTDIDIPHLRYPKFESSIPKVINQMDSIFHSIKQQDILLFHPYQSFDTVIGFIQQAATDPQVLAIKQTLYRVGEDSDILNALEMAARNGKEVTVVIELRARFDEEENLKHATRLQKAGATVCYGVVGFKTHAKLALVIRREENKIRRYTHLGTGNYHHKNAKLYTDFSLLTASDEIGIDVNHTFQAITGLTTHIRLHKIVIAPFALSPKIQDLIQHEIELASQGIESRIIFKINALTDTSIIQMLYKASQAGVKVDLIIRGICCLVPKIPGLSDNIRVISIVGRFLEHTRIYYFSHQGKPKVYLSSADLMGRNLHRRVETCFPIYDPSLVKRIEDEGLQIFLDDNVDAWEMDNDGHYHVIKNQLQPMSGQLELLKRYQK
ncbi:MAG: polyphosphate kinase 1 [Pseudomonadota bacterium]|nr:polyphosphate kinase 1 [Gammaproteobacteria bacterium]MEC8009568.1 polyphosphate kinase 1 [Pseudomonadota bacterium]|tara:strand:+ start:52517 stop:54577 length:2061 start_codon:yes stop_codon:yes gene_type:complete